MATTVAEDVRQILQEIGRPILEDLGFRPNALTVVVREESQVDPDTSALVPGTTISSLDITPRPRVRTMGMREVNESGGRYQMGDLRVDKVTPEYPGPPPGGYSLEQIAPDLEDFGGLAGGQECIYVVTGALAGEYVRVDFGRDRSLGWSLTLRRSEKTP